MRKYLLFLLTFFVATDSFSQDFSNKGKDFWVGYGYHQVMNGGNGQDMVLYFATDQVTNITISIPGTGYTQNITTPAGNNITTSATIPKGGAQDARLMTEGTLNKGIHITSDKPMVAYAHIYNSSVSGSCLLFPTNTLGKEYYSINYKNRSNSNNANCWFYVVAVDTGTTQVEITPSANTIGGWTAGTTYTVTLTQGQIYNVMGQLLANDPACPSAPTPTFVGVDLTGSLVKSVSNNGKCKKIGVYSGSGRISITSTDCQSSSDNYMVQAFPKAAWGKNFLTTPTCGNSGNMCNNLFRVCVSDPTAIVRINGTIQVGLVNNFYYNFGPTNQPASITSDKPITVAQYITSQGTYSNANPGDPEVIYLSPIEQNINDVTFNSNLLANPGSNQHIVSAVIPNGGTAISSFRIDGTVPGATFNVHPQNNAYSYITITGLAQGPHRLISDSGFNAIAYGYASAESYGYNAGTNVKDLLQQVGVSSQYGIEQTPNACLNSPFRFKISLPYRPDSLFWDFSGIPNANYTPPGNYWQKTPRTPFPDDKLLEDSSTIVAGKTIYWYSPPYPFIFNTVGVYPVLVQAYNTNNVDGCGNIQDIDFNLTVTAPPTANFFIVNNGCFTDSVRFFDSTVTTRPTYTWWWDFADGSPNATSKNPVHKFAAAGTYNVRFGTITTPGCVSDTIIKPITITPEPVADFTMSSPVCADKPVNFTNASSASGNGVLERWFWDYGDGAVDTVIAPANPDRIHTYSPWTNTMIARLKVATQTGCKSPVDSIIFKVHPNPVSTFTLPAGVCLPGASATFTATSTIADATPGLTYAWNFDDPAATVGNPNTATGSPVSHFFDGLNLPYDIQLRTTSAAGCFHDTIIPFNNVFVQEIPSAQPVAPGCVGNAINFVDNSTLTAGVTITTCHWDFGDGNTGTGCSTTHTYALPGTYTAYHWFVSSRGCQSDTIPITIVINPIPTATIAGTTAVCQNATSPDITFTGANGPAGAPYRFYYHINTGPAQFVDANIATGIATVPAPTGTPGVYIYTLDSVAITNTGCVQVLSPAPTATVTVNPLPTATISGTTAVCLNAASPNITFTGAAGTAPYTFTYRINGGAPIVSPPSNAAGVLNIPVSTAAAGSFVYTLESVQDASSTTCSQAQAGSATVTVNPLPTAVASGNTTVCLNAAQPPVTFDGSGSTAPYIFYYRINGGAVQNVTSNAAGQAVLNAPTTTAGTFVYTLDSVKDASSTTCVQLLSPAPQVTIIVEALPLAPTPGSNSPVCEGFPINLTATAVAGATGYNWTGPNTFTSTNQNPTIASATLAAAGAYTVTVTTGPTGCTSLPSTAVNVVVNVVPVITNTTASNPTTCSGSDGSITLSGLVAGSTYTVNYDKNGLPQTALSLTANGAGQITITGLTSGTYSNITCTILNCTSAPAPTQTLTDPNPPAAPTASSNSPICAGTSLNLTAGNVTNGSFNWTGPNGFTSSVQNPSIPSATVAASGNYSVTVTVANCVSAATIIPVTVNPLPTAAFAASVPSCATRDISFNSSASTANVGTIATYSWDFGDPASGILNTSSSPSPIHIFSTPGNYNVSLTITNSAGCTSIPTVNVVTINDRPLAGYIVPEVCLADTYAQFTDTSSIGAGTITGWDWFFDDPNATPGNLNTSNLPNPQHSYTAIGVYNVRLIVTSNLGCRDTIAHPLQINGSFPVSSFAVNTPATLCANDSVSIVNNSTVFPGVITKIEIAWDNTGAPGNIEVDNNPAAGKIYKHLYPNFQTPPTRTYQVRMRAFSGGVCQDDSIITITVNAAPRVQFNNMPDVCLDAVPFQITQASEIGGVPGVGTFSGPGVNATGTFNPASVGPGTYPILYTFTSTAAGCVDTMTKFITVLAPAVADFSISSLRCERSAITFTSSSTIPTASGTIANYSWDFGDGSPAQTVPVPTITHTYSNWNAVPFQVRLRVTTSNGCVSADKLVPLKVNSQPVANFTIPASLCIPVANATFTNTSVNPDAVPLTYLWNFGEPGSLNNTSTGVSPSHWYSSTGPFTVNLRATSDSGCVKDTNIILNTIHPQPQADFNFDRASVCIGDAITMTDNSNNGGAPITNWNWNLGDGSTRSIPSFAHTYGTDNTFTVTLYVTNAFGCNSDTLPKTVVVHPYPVVNAGPDKFVLEGGQVLLEPSATGNELQYLWTPNQFLAGNINNILAPTVLGVQDITYTLRVTARGGCARSDQVFIKVLKFPVIPNTFTPNNDGINDFWTISYLSTYPGNRVQVFTRDGQLVFESRGYGKPWDGTKGGKPLPMDTYYYIIEPGSGRAPLTGYVTIVK